MERLMRRPRFPLLPFLAAEWADMDRIHARHYDHERGLADLRRLEAIASDSNLGLDSDDPILAKPSVATAMNDTLLRNASYRRDHCMSFLVGMLDYGVTAEEGDLSRAMNLSSRREIPRSSPSLSW